MWIGFKIRMGLLLENDDGFVPEQFLSVHNNRSLRSECMRAVFSIANAIKPFYVKFGRRVGDAPFGDMCRNPKSVESRSVQGET